MANTAIKLGQCIMLEMNKNGTINLRGCAGQDSPVVSQLTSTRVKVMKISPTRAGVKSNALWIKVRGCRDLTKEGWIRYDCGGEIEINSVSFK